MYCDHAGTVLTPLHRRGRSAEGYKWLHVADRCERCATVLLHEKRLPAL